ncbi:MAG: hypothetical protein IT236_05005 [Bacteroidia bacterium]|nr:hypothetical protein [Bacteroidia bacterium]
MKKSLFILLSLILSISFSSCKKKNKKDPEPAPAPATTNPWYINFTLDGAAKSITSTVVSINTGYGAGGASSTSGFFNFTDNIQITLSMPLDSIKGSNLQSLVGQKIPIGSCGGCPTNIHLSYDINGDEYQSSDGYNALPTEYIKFNSVTYYNNVTNFSKNANQYYVTGEFNLKLNSGTSVKNATNGTFGLIFRESKK